MEHAIHIALSAETITTVFGIPITNTLITTWAVVAVLGMIALLITRRLSLRPGKLQLIFEGLTSFVMDYMEKTLESRTLARRYFPLIVTIFLFIFTANVLEFTPGIGSVGFFSPHGEFTPLLRSANTDLNTTLAITLIAFLAIEAAGIIAIGFFKYFHRFFNLSSPMAFFIGIIEFFSELARLVSFSFRLFGNIFAGEVIIAVVTAFVPLFVPVPLMLFEIFVGFIQAAIFAILTLFFIKLAITDVSH